RVNLSPNSSLLRVGENVLALQVWNDRRDSADFLLQAQLEDTHFTVGAGGYFSTPTPNAENSVAKEGLVDEVVFSQPHGFYSAALDVSLRTITENAVIRYTTNGDAPTATNGVIYS